MATLYYIHDPMCSWSYGFKQTWQQLQDALPDDIKIIRLLGGLAEDTDEPMPTAMKQKVESIWRSVAEHIPGVRFNYDFWQVAIPRRATYASCRAVIAARQQGEEYDIAMTEAIQQAYYHDARNPSDDAVLIALAAELGLDVSLFQQTLNSEQTQRILLDEISRARRMGVDSFPSLVLQHDERMFHIAIDYNDYRTMLQSIEQVLRQK